MKLLKILILLISITLFPTALFARSQQEWNAYIDGSVGKPLYYLYEQVVKNKFRGQRMGRALDLGSGAGNESVDLLSRGWDVTSVDQTGHSGEVITERAKLTNGKIHVYQSDFSMAPLNGEYQLVQSYFSLPFGDKKILPQLLQSISQHTRTGAIFSANFFGYQHSFVKIGEAYGINKEELTAILEQSHFHIIYYLNRAYDQPDFDGNKTHWDLIDLVAVRD